MANAGGIPISADLDQITDPKTKELIAAFDTIVKNDGLAYSPTGPRRVTFPCWAPVSRS